MMHQIRIDDYIIYVEVDNKKYTITTKDHKTDFSFIKSNPKTIRNIGALLIEASQIKEV